MRVFGLIRNMNLYLKWMRYLMVNIKDENKQNLHNLFGIWYRRGIELVNDNEYLKAVNCLNQALKIQPNHADTWYEKGLALYHMEHYEEALESFGESLRINSKDSDAWYAMGTTFFNMRLYSNALICYKETLKLDPNDAFTLFMKESWMST